MIDRIDIIGQNGNDGLHYPSAGLPTDYQAYIHKSKYARWRDDLGRRETWEETVDRYGDFFYRKIPLGSDGYASSEDNDMFVQAINAIKSLDVMPSMRALMTAGPALERDHIAGYNCFYRAIKHPNRFSEAMYILMCGTGVGFSVERQYVNELPVVAEEFHDTDTVINVRDSKLGWSKAFRELITLLYSGQIPKWDVSKVRPAGARLKTFGGRSSGPEPLLDLFSFSVEVFRNAMGRKLTSIECHDLMCKIADIVVVGGVRRSALISLSNLTDERMRAAKSGAWYDDNPQRALANNSVCYTEKPDMGIFMKEWESLYASKSGERGVFNRQAAQFIAARNGRRDSEHDFGTNPCSEIILRDGQFCNLTEVVVRSGDTFDTLKEKVRIASILGTLQSTLTDFKFIGKDIQRNTEEERLLGVSLTGIMDHPVLSGNTHTVSGDWFDKGFTTTDFITDEVNLHLVLQQLKEVAIETNLEWSTKLGIPASTAITCVKPSGTVSQLVDSASGIHTRHSDYYIRTVRADKRDPIYNFLKDQGVDCEDAVGSESTTAVFSFPIKAPDGCVTRDDRTAIEQLEHWKVYAEHWCEHKPSVTISVREHEWLHVGAWVYENFDICSGVSFLPHSDHIYKQPPYQEIDESTYKEMVSKISAIDWEILKNYESEDMTVGSQELACTGGACEIL